MSSSIRVLGAVVVIGLTAFGLLAVFGIIPSESLPESAGKMALGAAVVLGGILGVKLMGAGRGSINETEPPPQL